jgi:hypothetical protein
MRARLRSDGTWWEAGSSLSKVPVTEQPAVRREIEALARLQAAAEQ